VNEDDLISRGILNTTNIKSHKKTKLSDFLITRPAKRALELKNIIQAFNPVFSVALEELYQRTKRTIPYIVEKCCDYLREYSLNTEGVFRISGNARVIQALKLMFNQVDFIDLSTVCKSDVHTVAGLFKLFLRELPEPLFTFKRYPKFIAIFKTKGNQQEKDSNAALLIAELPDSHLYFLKFLIEFLQEVIAHSAVNKMTSNNLARIFGPVLLVPEHTEDEGDTPILMLGDSPLQIEIFQRILDTNLFGALGPLS